MASILHMKRIACMKYITTFVVSKETEQKETNEKRKQK